MSLTALEKVATDLLRALALRTFAFEGINGAGKGTAIAAVAEGLEKAGKQVYIFRDPGSHPVAQKIRTLLKDPAHKMDSMTQVLLFSAARRLLLEEMVAAFIRTPDAVFLLDRWVWSTMAYQCANGVPEELVLRLYKEFSPLPVDTFHGVRCILLEIEPRTALYRVAKAKNQDIQEDRFEAQGVSYLEEVARLYDKNSLGYTRRVPATLAPDEVARTCLSFITSVL